MGLSFSRLWERMFGKKEMRILMVGLDAAGKVSLVFAVSLLLSLTLIFFLSFLALPHFSLFYSIFCGSGFLLLPLLLSLLLRPQFCINLN
jgi:hypothetical protein